MSGKSGSGNTGRIIRLVRHIPAGVSTAIVIVAILWLTLAPHPLPENDVPLFPHADKLVHAVMFGGFAWVAGIDSLAHRRKTGLCRHESVRTMIICAVIAIIFGGLIEFVQDAMGMGRSADWIDWLADAAGALLAVPVGIFTAGFRK